MADATSLNRDYFNQEAASYDSKHEKAAEEIISKIRAHLDFIGVEWIDDDEDGSEDDVVQKGTTNPAPEKSVRLLDYACGTGNVSKALAPNTTQCVGIDLSESMVKAYNTRAANQGLEKSEMYAYVGNLCSASEPRPAAFADPEFFGFDIAVIGMGLHHFEDPDLATARLVERLGSGGVLMVVDFIAHEPLPIDHPATKTVTHHGFTAERVKDMFEKAGAGTDFGLTDIGTVTMFGGAHGGHHGHGHGHEQRHGQSHGHGHSKEEGAREKLGVKRGLFLARGSKR